MIRAIFWGCVVAMPVGGVWLASSLATFLDGPQWLAIASGAALFPGLPLLWELYGRRRFSQKTARRAAAGKAAPERWLTLADRLILRTVLVNLVFLLGLIGLFPAQSFMAVSSRGDWFLDSAEPGPTVDVIREGVFKAAESLEWVYVAVSDNPYDTEPPPEVIDQAEEEDVVPLDDDELAEDDALAEGDVNIGSEIADLIEGARPQKPVDVEPADDGGLEEGAFRIERGGDIVRIMHAPTGPNRSDVKIERVNTGRPPSARPLPGRVRPSVGRSKWPMKTKLHPLVVNMPVNVEVSIQSVGKYLARETNPTQRVKAIHDYVADRIAYDLNSMGSGKQEADVVFKRRTAVCEGYAKLVAALGVVTGDEVLYVPGIARGSSVLGHAWNAVKISGRWHLLDATWDAGSGDGVKTPFKKRYRTDYFLTPPRVFVNSHLADRADLQLLEKPVTKAEWMRLPDLNPGFYKQGLTLISPLRPQVNVGNVGVIKLKNPRKRTVIASAVNLATGQEAKCKVVGGETVRCKLGVGRHRVTLFSGPKGARKFWDVGKFEMLRN